MSIHELETKSKATRDPGSRGLAFGAPTASNRREAATLIAARNANAPIHAAACRTQVVVLMGTTCPVTPTELCKARVRFLERPQRLGLLLVCTFLGS